MSNSETIEIELRSKDDQKLEEIWAQLKRHLAAANPELPYSPIEHIVRELVFNSIKANLKRIFLEEQGGQSENGAAALDFREALENVSPELMQKAEASDRYVRVRFADLKTGAGGFEVTVVNNTEMLPGEKELVDRLLFTDDQVGPEEAPSGESVSGEGGGLGLRMVRKILHNCGLGQSALRYETADARTAFTLRVPAGNH
ncbi:MAG: hypothetical protein NXI24_16185 [bacterium]|nr:hypothetical protein [bacterium]